MKQEKFYHERSCLSTKFLYTECFYKWIKPVLLRQIQTPHDRLKNLGFFYVITKNDLRRKIVFMIRTSGDKQGSNRQKNPRRLLKNGGDQLKFHYNIIDMQFYFLKLFAVAAAFMAVTGFSAVHERSVKPGFNGGPGFSRASSYYFDAVSAQYIYGSLPDVSRKQQFNAHAGQLRNDA